MFNAEKDYRSVFRIRNFEKKILDLFSQNKLTGTTHTCQGQEATPVALMDYIKEEDSIFGSHRCHGYFISYAGETKPLLAEIMGRTGGMCKGRGGSQHVCYKNFTTNGVQGGIVPNATGIALAEKYKKTGGIAVVILGDGTLGQGVVYESMNMASLFSAPILYVIEDNGYAMTTPSCYAIQGNLKSRFEGFGVHYDEICSNDTEVLRPFFEDAVNYVRNEGRPMCAVIRTYRLGPHSKSDDTRPAEEIEKHKSNDPLLILENKVEPAVAKRIREEEIVALDAIVADCEQMPVEGSDVLSDSIDYKKSFDSILNHSDSTRCISAINEGLKEFLINDSKCLLLGEDIRDPYGGAFKATKGLTDQFSDRILNTPISEPAMIGISVGMAMHGLHPIVEMMFGDFISLGFDQLLNHAGKYNWMYDGQVTIPMIVRAPMGGKRGYGATHSQSLEKFLVGIPGIDVIALSPLHDPVVLYRNLRTNITKPTVIIEDKALYGQRLLEVHDGMYEGFYVNETNEAYPIISLTMDTSETPDVAIITYGGLTKEAISVAEKLMMEEEILAKVIIISKLNEIDFDKLVEIVGNTKKIVVAEAGTHAAGWGAEIVASLSERLESRKYIRIAAPNLPIPCNKVLEDIMIPDANIIYRTIKNKI